MVLMIRWTVGALPYHTAGNLQNFKLETIKTASEFGMEVFSQNMFVPLTSLQ
jgi:hypothetical protein